MMFSLSGLSRALCFSQHFGRPIFRQILLDDLGQNDFRLHCFALLETDVFAPLSKFQRPMPARR